MRKLVISGGPHTGKTTLLESLRAEMPDGIHFIPEPASVLIRGELTRQESGVPMISVPAGSVPERAGMVVEAMQGRAG
jgi:predicted ATPase